MTASIYLVARATQPNGSTTSWATYFVAAVYLLQLLVVNHHIHVEIHITVLVVPALRGLLQVMIHKKRKW